MPLFRLLRRAFFLTLVAAVLAATGVGAVTAQAADGDHVRTDLIDDPGFEAGFAGFELGTNTVGVLSRQRVGAIVGDRSLRARINDGGKVLATADIPPALHEAPDTVGVEARIRVEKATPATNKLVVCAIATPTSGAPRQSCQQVPLTDGTAVVETSVTTPAGDTPLRDVTFRLSTSNANGGSVTAMIDQAKLYLLSPPATPATPVPVPDGFELVDLIADNGVEGSLAGFGAVSASDGTVARSTTDPIAGTSSLRTTIQSYGRVASGHDYPYAAGPVAHSVTTAAKVRVDSSTPVGRRLQVCTIAYLQTDSDPRSACATYPVDPSHVVPVLLSLDTQDQQLARVFTQLKLDDSGSVAATLDDVHLYVVQQPAPDPGDGGGDPGDGGGDPGDGGGGGPTSGDLEQLGFAMRPTNWRSMTAQMNLADDLSGAGAPANAAARDISVTLHPAADAVGASRRVSFGLPLAPGTLVDTAQVKVTDADGHELPAYVRSLGAWTHMPDQRLLCNGLQATGNPGIRSVLVQFDMAFADTAPRTVTVSINRARSQNLASAVPVRDTYRVVNDGTYAPAVNHSGLTVREPAVLAAIDHNYLACTSMVPMTAVAGQQPSLAKTDQASDDFFYSTINQPKQSWPVTNPEDIVDYFTDSEPWLYDRAQTFYNGYLRTGNVDMLREGNRAVDQYQQQIYGPQDCATTFYPYCVGSFKLKNTDPAAPYPDLKYSYSENLLSEYLLTGDPTVLQKIGYVSWGQEMHVGLTQNGPDTERHRAFALLAHVVDYELTGSAHELGVVQDAIAAMRAKQTSTVNGNAPNGCFNYAPEGEANTFSPWMSALLAQAFERAYFATGNAQVGPALVDLAQCELDRGTDEIRPGQQDPMAVGDLYPYYIGASYGTKHDADGDNPFNGLEHAIDVAVPVSLGAFFATDPAQKAAFVTATKRLLKTNEAFISYFTRDGAETAAAGRTKYRTSPPRRYNWQLKNVGVVGWGLGS